MDRRALSDGILEALELRHPPLAVSFPDEIPPGVASFDGVVPAGCRFWQTAMHRTFATSARDHALCAIGVHTHHLSPAPAAQMSELQDTLAAMQGLDYVRPDEVGAIPVLAKPVAHVVYGPLRDHPLDPAVVMLFANARQSLLVSEAAARVDDAAPPAMGRPACAALPQAMNRAGAVMSLGCCGARAYLDPMTEDMSLWCLPGEKLARYGDQIAVMAAANRSLGGYHRTRARDVEEGGRPSVAESLRRASA